MVHVYIRVVMPANGLKINQLRFHGASLDVE